MSCLRSRNSELMERYLREALPDNEAEEFEAHVLECGDCADELERIAAIAADLSRRRQMIEAESTSERSGMPWLWLAVAAVFLLAAGLLLVIRPWSRDELASLASVEPPIYQESQLRGVADDADQRFKAGMELYSETDYRGAMRELQAAAELDPDRIEVQFFLGACRLLNGENEEATRNLNRVIAQADTPYLEEALFLRAQAHLLLGEADAAAEDLRSILELGGDWESRAKEQLAQLEARQKQDR